MRQENQVTSYSMPGEICSLSIILEINGKIWGGEIWGCRKLQAGRWALTFGGKQLESVMEVETEGEINLKTSTYAVNYGGKKTVRQTRFIIFYRVFPPPLPQNKIFGGGEGIPAVSQ